MFVGRVKELKDLEEAYRSEKGEFVILYGRRRIGKTNLLVEFCKDKNTGNLQKLPKKIYNFFTPFPISPRDWQQSCVLKSVAKAIASKASFNC